MDLDKRILEYGNKEVKRILEEGNIEALNEAKDILDEAKLDYETKINNVKKEVKEDIATEERMLSSAKKQAELLAKQRVLSEIFEEVKEKIASLTGEDLLTYVVNKIKVETINGDEIMHVNEAEFKKYSKALSTSKKVKGLIDLDILNAELNTNIKLSTEYNNINGGFILEGKYFDLNFAIDELIEKLINKHERTIVKKLFE